MFKIIKVVINTLGTLGVRYYVSNRICVEREIKTIDLEINNVSYPIRYKYSYLISNNQKKNVNIKPEYDDLRIIREKTGYPIKKLQHLFFSTINFDRSKFL